MLGVTAALGAFSACSSPDKSEEYLQVTPPGDHAPATTANQSPKSTSDDFDRPLIRKDAANRPSKTSTETVMNDSINLGASSAGLAH